MVRFLHTSDWQMGMRADHAGAKSKEVRNIRFSSASRLVSLAKEEQVDFVVIAGDVFEHHDVDDVVVKRTVDIINQIHPIPVYVLPGNHDPWVPGGIWDRQSWRRIQDHVVLCTEPTELQFNDVVAIYPCPLNQKRSTLDPTSWIPERLEGDTRIRIGIAHGALDLLPDNVNFPVLKERAERCGLNYLAMGDWHSPLQHGHTVYSGTPEPTSFSERDPGYAVVVDIRSFSEVPKLQWKQTRTLAWSQLEPAIQDVTDVESLDMAIKGLGALDTLVLSINPVIDSQVDLHVVELLRSLRAELEERVFLLEWQDDSDALTKLELATDLPDGILQRVDEALSNILDGRIPGEPASEFAGVERSVVQEAQTLLHRIAGGGSR